MAKCTKSDESYDEGKPSEVGAAYCGHCGLARTPEGHDGCLGTLPDVMNACCGHGGQAEGAYVQFLDGTRIADDEAHVFFVRHRSQELVKLLHLVMPKCTKTNYCTFEAGHNGDNHPCGRQMIKGVTSCQFCGHLDGSPECTCWTPVANVPDEAWEDSGLKLGPKEPIH